MKGLAMGAIQLYKRILSPYAGGSCRYMPTCSHYSYEVIAKFGVIKGGWLTLKRLARCHPLGSSGYDPVP